MYAEIAVNGTVKALPARTTADSMRARVGGPLERTGSDTKPKFHGWGNDIARLQGPVEVNRLATALLGTELVGTIIIGGQAKDNSPKPMTPEQWAQLTVAIAKYYRER